MFEFPVVIYVRTICYIVAGFTVEARDANGNARPEGGDKFEVELRGRANAGLSPDVGVKNMKDGTYAVRFSGEEEIN